ncbi:hypothetical protein LTR10_015696 [Elasticomyces elasticus]|uniref:NADH dehydrogenase [ubiquinone] 1 alpha subcomplex assembly factor 3 n=1 Tax=Elasticomyces elasticus TaxID=574655 RepID=A0AAN7ZQG3_9PEZI|nr:hypothetical protein LTR10_015696 [Elasticomyces elasticus]KAK4975471.1 hypothetical protein LTR42_004682 [Elasticomyces elasticus]KAK5690216.1 hypothetical protein LTR97_012404 [Elasticomyces elasticus]
MLPTTSAVRALRCHGCFHRILSGRQQEVSRALASQQRCFHPTPATRLPSAAPKSRDRGPTSKEDTQTDFGAMDMLSNTPAPTTAVDSCMNDGFALNSGLKVTGSGVLLVGGEAFKWRPWLREGGKEGAERKIMNKKGQFDVDEQAWGLLGLAWPKPDLMILGTGPSIVPVSPETRRHINELGIRLEVQDTRNAAAQFNMLATERGVQQVVGALIPVGWREGK